MRALLLDALSVGYRHIDTAQSYFNEEEVGSAIKKSGIPRKELFITTKVWVEHYGYEETKKSIENSLKKLQTNYIDLVSFCTNRLPTFTALGGLWKNFTTRASSKQSA